MTRMTAVPVFLLGSLLCQVPTGAAEPAPEQRSEPLGVLCLTPERPVALGFDLAVNGVQVTTAWERFADALFAFADADTSGTIDGPELIRLPQTLTLLTHRLNFPTPPAAPAMNRAALGEYLRKNNLGPFSPPMFAGTDRGGERPGERPRRGIESTDKALMELLDTNKDGKLSRTELAAAPAILAQLDADENELINLGEILKRPVDQFLEYEPSDPPGPGGEPGAPGTRLELLRYDRKGASAAVAQRLLGYYRPRPKGEGAPGRCLTKDALKIPDSMFAALDRDGNDELDAAELARFGAVCVPEVVVALQLGTPAPGTRTAAVVTAGKRSVTATTTGEGTGASVTLPGGRIDLDAARWATAREWRANFSSQFRAFDRDANGYLDEEEARNSGLFRVLFKRLDADNDGKVFEKELNAALDEVGPLVGAAGAIVTADVTEAGRGLMGLFDTDGDGQLSVRELRGMAQLLAGPDATLDPDSIPRRYRMTFSSALGAGGLYPQRIEGGQGVRRRPVGPLWFQKMDRNRDGDVSRREFLGTEEEFRRLDRDGDGLIDASEAEAAGQRAPK